MIYNKDDIVPEAKTKRFYPLLKAKGATFNKVFVCAFRGALFDGTTYNSAFRVSKRFARRPYATAQWCENKGGKLHGNKSWSCRNYCGRPGERR